MIVVLIVGEASWMGVGLRSESVVCYRDVVGERKLREPESRSHAIR